MTTLCCVNDMPKMSIMLHWRCPCLSLFLQTTISLSSRTVGCMWRHVCQSCSSTWFSPRSSQSRHLFSTCKHFLSLGCITKSSRRFTPNFQQDPNSGVPGPIYLRQKCLHWRPDGQWEDNLCGVCIDAAVEQERIAEGSLYWAVSGDGGSEGEGMEGEVWKCTGREGDSKLDGRDKCGFEATGKRRCPCVHADTGTFFVVVVLFSLLIWIYLVGCDFSKVATTQKRTNAWPLDRRWGSNGWRWSWPTYEVVISRTQYVERQTGNKTRIVACGVSLANAEDLGKWMGASEHTIFNFSPRFVVDTIPCLFIYLLIVFEFFSARPLDMAIHTQSFTINHFPSLMIAMSKPAYLAIKEHSSTKPVVIFVPSRRQCRLTVDDLLTHCAADERPDRVLLRP